MKSSEMKLSEYLRESKIKNNIPVIETKAMDYLLNILEDNDFKIIGNNYEKRGRVMSKASRQFKKVCKMYNRCYNSYPYIKMGDTVHKMKMRLRKEQTLKHYRKECRATNRFDDEHKMDWLD